jgi:hypothetical protein
VDDFLLDVSFVLSYGRAQSFFTSCIFGALLLRLSSCFQSAVARLQAEAILVVQAFGGIIIRRFRHIWNKEAKQSGNKGD